MGTPILRDYQEKGIIDIRNALREGAKRICFTLPTGGGKTVLFSHIATNSASKGFKVAIFASRDELVKQISQTLRKFNQQHGIIKSGYPEDLAPPVQVGSVFTMINRFDRFAHFDLIIVDECDEIVAGSYKKIITNYPDAIILGVTATPCRLDGRGLGEVFDTLILGPTTKQMIENKHLSPYRYFAPLNIDLSKVKTLAGDYETKSSFVALNQPDIYGDTIKNYRKFSDGQLAVAFCINIKHAELTAESFNNNGIPAVAIHGKLSREQNSMAIQGFKSGKYKILVSCDLISKGFDLPEVTTAILMRPTKSLMLYLQQVGRCLRIADGKSHAVIIDMVNNYQRHWMPDDERVWSLDSPKRKKSDTPPPYARCESCLAVMPANQTTCHVCGDVRLIQNNERKIKHDETAELEEVTRHERIRNMTLSEIRKKVTTRKELYDVAKAKGYKPGWAYYKAIEWGLR